MTFKEFSTYLERLDGTSSRLAITSLLAELFGKLTPDEIREVCYLLTNGVAPSYEGVVFNIADKMMHRALAKAYEVELTDVLAAHKNLGDIGQVAFTIAENAKGKYQETGIDEIFNFLLLLAKEQGDGSQEKRIDILCECLAKLTPTEAKYFTRIVLGNMRLGFSDKTMIDALSQMETGGKDKSSAIVRAYEVIPDIGTLAQKIKEEGIDKATKHVMPIVGIPVAPMLCQRLKSPTEMIKKMGEVAVEPKFDGLRVLIHYSKPKKILRAFTRNLKDISQMFPELTKIGEHVDANELILDSEVVGVDPTLMKILDFQTTMHRRRKNDIEDMVGKIPVTFQVYDVIYANGKSLMDEPYVKRREVLSSVIKNGSLLKVDDYTITKDPALITKLHFELRKQGLEGVIVKKADSMYKPGRTGWNWVKMKEAEDAVGKLSDTIDAVIMGYTSGRGKRVDFGVGQFLAGVKEKDQFVTLTKVGTGLTDEQFRALFKRLVPLKTDEKPKEYDVHKDLTPDFWVIPNVVVELAGDDLTVSPKHTAGYALRFPRLVKFRDDKDASRATTVKEVKKLFELQKV
jgi:DNA ligase 1